MQPSFEIDSTGKVLCKSHTYHDILKEVPLEYDFLGHLRREKALNCSRCTHYRDDDCFFPKSEIDKIKRDMGIFHKGFRCEICRGRIHQIFNVLFKFQSKELLKVNLGMVCCDCYRTLKDENYKSLESKGIIIFSSIFLIAHSISMIFWVPALLQSTFFIGLIFIPLFFYMAFVLLYLIIRNFIKIIKRNQFKNNMLS